MVLTSRGVRMIVIVSVLVFLATVAVAMRLLARRKLRMKLGSDDFLCVVALVCLWGMLVELALCEFLLHMRFLFQRTPIMLTSLSQGVPLVVMVVIFGSSILLRS